MKKAKKPWIWHDADCLRAVAEAIKEAGSTTQVAKILDKNFYSTRGSDEITRCVVISGLSRPNVRAAFTAAFGEEGPLLYLKFVDNRNSRKSKKFARLPKTPGRKERPKKVAETGPSTTSAPAPVLREGPPPLKIDGRSVCFATLEDTMCRFMYGQDEYCGRQVLPGRGRQYCAEHHKLIHDAPVPEKKKTNGKAP